MIRALQIALLAFAMLGCEVAHGDGDRVTLYVPPFQGPDALGQSISTFLNLQLWGTLRKEPPRPDKKPPTLGVVVWGRPLEAYGHEGAEARAKQIALLAQLVFWGKVYAYGDGALALTNLSLPRYEDFREDHPEIWRVRIRARGTDSDIEADVPQRRYSFRPVVLSKEIISRYSKPEAIEIHERRDGGRVIGHIGNDFTRETQEGDDVRILSDGIRGWIRLPKLSEQRSEAISFAGGVVRAMRGDWKGVQELMSPVAEGANTPNELRTDAYLYQGLAEEKQGRRGAAFFAKAMTLSPNARRCIVYSTMSELAEFKRRSVGSAAVGELQDFLKRARALLAQKSALFSPSDPWFQQVQHLMDDIDRDLLLLVHGPIANGSVAGDSNMDSVTSTRLAVVVDSDL